MSLEKPVYLDMAHLEQMAKGLQMAMPEAVLVVSAADVTMVLAHAGEPPEVGMTFYGLPLWSHVLLPRGNMFGIDSVERATRFMKALDQCQAYGLPWETALTAVKK